MRAAADVADAHRTPMRMHTCHVHARGAMCMRMLCMCMCMLCMCMMCMCVCMCMRVWSGGSSFAAEGDGTSLCSCDVMIAGEQRHRGHASRTCIEDMHRGHASRMCIEDVHRGCALEDVHRGCGCASRMCIEDVHRGCASRMWMCIEDVHRGCAPRMCIEDVHAPSRMCTEDVDVHRGCGPMTDGQEDGGVGHGLTARAGSGRRRRAGARRRRRVGSELQGLVSPSSDTATTRERCTHVRKDTTEDKGDVHVDPTRTCTHSHMPVRPVEGRSFLRGGAPTGGRIPHEMS